MEDLGPGRQARPKKLKLRGASPANWFGFIMPSIALLAFIGLLIGGIFDNKVPWPLVIGACGVLLFVPIVMVGISRTIRAVTLTHSVIHFPTAFGFKRLPISSVAGIGMWHWCTVGTNRPEGWCVEVWDITGKRIEVDRFSQWNGGTRLNEAPEISFSPWEIEHVSTTRPGQMALDMYSWVLEHQGPAGPLVSENLQKSQGRNKWDMVNAIAWWSPDGTMGRVQSY
jgi:hypothetical protein